jgi:hypothetical protein
MDVDQRTLLEKLAVAAGIVDSAPVLRVYAACEWDCLNDDGKLWLAEIVHQARAEAAAAIATLSARVSELELERAAG